MATQQGEEGGTKDGKPWKDFSQHVKNPGTKPPACISSQKKKKKIDDTPSWKGECAAPNGAASSGTEPPPEPSSIKEAL